MSKKTKVVIIFSSIALACIIGAGIIIGVFFSSNNNLSHFSNFFTKGVEIDENEQLNLKGISSLTVECISGNIDFIEADTASVELKGKVWGNQLKENYLSVYEKDGAITAKFDLENQFFNFFNSDMRMTVYLPKENMLDIDIISTSGDIKIESMQFGDMTISSTSGNTLINDCAGESLDLNKTSGETDISAAEFNSIDIVCLSGNIDIARTPADIAISSTSGDTKISKASGALTVKSTSGKITAQILGNAPSVDIGLTSGNVKLFLDGNAAFDLSAKATSGNIETDFDITVSGNKILEESMSGKCNGGGEQINITTTSGNISVMKD